MPRLFHFIIPFFFACVSAGTLNFCYPPYSYGKFLAWFTLIPFFLGLFLISSSNSQTLELSNSRTPYSSTFHFSLFTFLYGFTFGFLYHLGVLSWVIRMWSAWHSSFITGAISTILLCFYGSLYFGIISVITGNLLLVTSNWLFVSGRSSLVTRYFFPFLVSALWVSVEYVVSQTLGGLTWTLLGYTQWDNLPIMQVSSFMGIYGISFLIVLCNATLSVLLFPKFSVGHSSAHPPTRSSAIKLHNSRTPQLSNLKFVIPSIVILIAVYVYGKKVLSNSQLSAKPPVRTTHNSQLAIKVGVVHSNIDLDKQFDPDFDSISLAAYEKMVRQICPSEKSDAKKTPLVVLWPETSFPDMSPETPPEIKLRVEKLLKQTNSFNIVGVITQIPVGEVLSIIQPTNSKFAFEDRRFNSAVLFSPSGRPLKEYHKIIPLYFAETMPFFKTLRRYINMEEWFPDTVSDIFPGNEYTLFPIPSPTNSHDERREHRTSFPSQQRLGVGGGSSFGVTLCWEPAFPHITRNFVKSGANVLANLSEGMWYQNQEKAQSQHFMINRFRSVENRRYFVVSGNNLYSGVIDPYGRIQKIVSPGIDTAFVEDVFPRSDMTFYVQHGDWFAWCCIGLTFLGIFLIKLNFFSVTSNQ